MKTNGRDDKTLSSNKRIVSAGLFSRTVSALVDFAIVAFVGGLLMMAAQPIFGATDLVKVPFQTINSYLVDSNLYTYNQEDEMVPHTYETYEEYEDLIFGYFSDYKVNKAPEEFRIDYSKIDVTPEYWYNVNIYGLEDVLNKFDEKVEKARPDFVISNGPEIFQYAASDTDQSVLDYNKLAVKKESVEPKTAKDYYFMADADNKEGKPFIYALAVADLHNTPYFQSAFNAWNLWFYYVPLFISFVLSAVIFLFVIPMCLKYGCTLGKLMFHEALVNNLGYDISRGQIVLRFWVPVLTLVLGFIVCQFIPKSLLAFLGFCTIFLVISYCLVIFTKDHKAIHDYIAMTQVINTNESVWYKNASEEDVVLTRASTATAMMADDSENLEEELKGREILYVNHNFNKGDGDEKQDIKDEENTSEK